MLFKFKNKDGFKRKTKIKPKHSSKIKTNENGNYKITLAYSDKITKFVFGFMYNDKIKRPALDEYQIINLMHLIEELQLVCDTKELKEYYFKQFASFINIKNWLELLCLLFGNTLFENYCDEIIEFYKDNILISSDMEYKLLFLRQIENVQPELKQLLLMETFRHLNEPNNESES